MLLICIAGASALFLIVLIAASIQQIRRDSAWQRWQVKHGWPLRERPYRVADAFIKAQKKLGAEATPEGLRDHIARQSGQEFPLELCRALLETVAMHGLQAMPPSE